MEKSPVVSCGSWVVRASGLALACALACCVSGPATGGVVLALADEAPASADASAAGFVTVSGAAGIDAATPFASLDEAVAALAGAPSVAPDATSVTLLIHGSVEASAPLTLPVPAGAQAVGIVGEGAGAELRGATGTLSLASAGGSLVVRGVTLPGAVSLTSDAGLSVDGCSLTGTLGCTAAGTVSVSGNTLASAAGDAVAVSVTLSGADATATIGSNAISGYGSGVAVTLADGVAHPRLSVTNNTFALGGTASVLTALHLGGAAWSPSSVTFEGNVLQAATCLVMLDASFGVENPQFGDGSDPAIPRSLTLADGTLDAPGIAGVFELLGRGTGDSSQACDALLADSTLSGANPAVAEITSGAATLLFPEEHAAAMDEGDAPAVDEAVPADAAEAQTAEPVPVEQAGTFIVAYAANGASAGSAPAAQDVAAGAKAAVATAGSLVNAGYEFRGWNTAADGSGTFYAVGQVFVPSSDVTLYAQWAPTGTVATVSVTSAATGA